jgi:hypothetical protein
MDSREEQTIRKLTDWENEPKLSELKNDFRACKPSHDLQISKMEEWKALLEVEGTEKPKAPKGRSRVQPKLVRRQAEWRYSALSEPFLGSDKVFSVTPKTFEDEQAAKQNELLLNWQFNTKLNKVKLIDDYVRAVINEGTGIAKVSWCRETKPILKQEPIFQAVPVQDEQTLQQLNQAAQLSQSDPHTYNDTVPPEIQYGVQVMSSGQVPFPVIGQVIGYQQVPDEEIICNHPYVEILDPRNVYIDPSCAGDFERAYFVIESFETSYSELVKDGRYTNLEMINWDETMILNDGEHESPTPDDFNFDDKGRKKVVAYEYWGYYDIHGDGSLVPIVATWVKNVLIRLEENPYPDKKLPYVLVPYLPQLRTVYGEADAELLGDNQRILGAVTRGMIDSLGRSANAQQGFAKGFLDPVNKKKFMNGEDYEFNPNLPPQAAFVEHQYPELPQSAMLMIQMQNQEAEALTGVKAFSGGLAGDAYNTKVATAIRGVLDAASKREMAILRRLARGMQEIGNKIIAMNAVFLSETEVVRVTNRQYVPIKREDLRGNFDLEVDIATAEEDNAKSENLAFLFQTLGNSLDDKQVLMRVLAEWADLKRLPALAEYFRTWQPDPQQVQMQQQMQQLQMQNLELQNQKLQSEIVENQANAEKLGADAQTKAIDAQTKAITARATLPDQVEKIKADTELTKAQAGKAAIEAQYMAADAQMDIDGTKHLRELQKMQAQARGNQDLEIVKAMAKPRKPEETKPDFDAMYGFNIMTDELKQAALRR